MSATSDHERVPGPSTTPSPSRPTPRRRVRRGAVRGAALGLLVAAVAGAAPAFAEEPVGWESSPSVSGLQYFVVLLLVPLGLALLISLLVAIPSWARGTSYEPGQLWAGEEWFGGPKDGLEKASEPEQIEAAGDQGGAGARY